MDEQGLDSQNQFSIADNTDLEGSKSMDLDFGDNVVGHKNHYVVGEGEKLVDNDLPKTGMEFNTTEEAYNYYNIYARMIGFRVRKQRTNRSTVNRSKILRYTLCCACEGYYTKRLTPIKKREERRFGCKAKFEVKLNKNEKYELVKFFAEHTHELLPLSHTLSIMAQFQAISQCSSANPMINATKRTEFSLNSNRVFCSKKKMHLYQEGLGAKLTQSNSTRVVRAQLVSGGETDVSGSTKTGGLRGKLNKVVLAYSGGLDTSVIVPWLRENYGCEVVCFTADVGQGITELDGLEEKAKASGASQLVVKDLTEEFAKDFIFPCLRAGAIYERKYLLGTSMARLVIAKAMVDVAKAVGADAVAHGCTGKGNDQVRFELIFFALNPELNVVAPWREWDITGQEDAIEYAKKHNVPVPVTKKSIYSRDRNLWHLGHEGDILEDPANEPRSDMYMTTVDPEDAPNEPEYLEIGIVCGIPVSLDGKELSPATLLAQLNEIGGRHGIGRIDLVENRLVGMKSRRVYETPGGTILFTAVRELEMLTLDHETMQFKDTIALKYAELVYAGRWFDPLREAMDAFMERITKDTTGSVRLKLYKGSVNVVGRRSPNSLY